MKDKLGTFYKKHKSVINYVFVGAVTTFSNIVTFWILNKALGVQRLRVSVWAAWAISVSLAYIGNRLWVFAVKPLGTKGMVKEIASFFGSRFLTGALDDVIMHFFVVALGANANIIKVLSNIIVIVLNYLLSKYAVFKDW